MSKDAEACLAPRPNEETLVKLLNSMVLILQELSFEFGGTAPMPGEIELERSLQLLDEYRQEVQKDTLLN
jgi:hypothetical protein